MVKLVAENKQRSINIDVIKGLAIISVILIHTYDGNLLLGTGAPLHIWQAVPVFMILQGLNNANSYMRRDFNTLSDFLDPSYFSQKFKRLLFSYFIFFIFQTIFLRFYAPDYFFSENHLIRLITGGRGPGSYFVPLTIQAQIVLPLLFVAAKKSVKGMLAGSLIINILLEVFCSTINIDEELYRILIIRFIFAMALGVALAFLKDDYFKQGSFYILVVLSAIYIIGVMYFDWHFIMEHYWHSQHVPGFFWPLFLIILLNGVKMPPNNKIYRVLSVLGKASYHIFLAQLFYFWKPISESAPTLPTFFDTIVNVVVCCVLGVIFYELEQNFWERVENKSID